MTTTLTETTRRQQIRFVLEQLEHEPLTAAALKAAFLEQFPDAEESSERHHLMTSLNYSGMIENVGVSRNSAYIITDIGRVVLQTLRAN